MSGLFYLLSMIGLLLVIRWLVKNDNNPLDQPDTGMFAMKDRITASGKRKFRSP
jgi:hypothetical protein